MRLLIISKFNSELITASQIALKQGCKVKQIDDLMQAYKIILEGEGADLVLISTDLEIGAFVNTLRDNKVSMPIIACGINTASEEAVRAINLGVDDFLPLPPDEELIAAILAAITKTDKAFIHCSEEMKKIAELAKKVANSDATILITGSSGTGKEVLARYIYNNSLRKDKQFVAVNCAAIPENLLESELFGHEKGAFTGAINKRIGKFEEANNGTILLDEISEIDMKLQAKLLRVLQEREVDRIGSSQPVKVNIRVIATSNRDLKKEVAAQRFREDLYFRLNIININLPNLQNRPDEILLISEYYIKKYSDVSKITPPFLSPEARDLLLSYRWPGNIRELENAMYRGVLLADKIIKPEDLMLSEHKAEEITDYYNDTEVNNIVGSFGRYLNDQVKAAEILGITINKFMQRLDAYKKEV